MAIGTPVSVGTGEGTSSGTTVALTTSATVPAGGRIILACGWTSAVSISSVAGGSLSWVVDHTFVNTQNSAYSIALVSAEAPGGLSSGTTITVTFSGSTFARLLYGCYVTGLALSSYEDGTSTGASGSTGTSDTWETASVTTTNADDLLIVAAFLDFFAVTSTPAALLNELLDFTHSETMSATFMYRIVSSTGSYTGGGTWGGAFPSSGPWTSVIVAYKGEVSVVEAPEKLRIVQSNLRQA